ncbi:MAG: adenylate/guanylate cyclase domain-containing protein, partial [Planctomycetota bacterium]
MESRVLTIMLTDMKGFTETSGARSREGMMDLVRKHDDLLRPILLHFGGRIIKTIGDAFLVTFESPTNAVLCGLLLQHHLGEHNRAAAGEERIEVRISLNTGEVQITEDDIFGEPVNIAARINAITDANEVYFTEAVYLAMNKAEVPSSEIGERRLKGIAQAIRVYKVIQDPAVDQVRSVFRRYEEAVQKGTT